MKPLKLTMTAFGPYKNTEVIDFNELQENKLFVISGNTGAGKTTIFDGISFALYGTASGSDREDNKMLRSDFADDQTHTSVELEFELRDRRYRILRQLGHIKQGNKSKTGESYEFYERVNGTEIPCVDRQIVSEIDRKVEELIGLTQDQFKQIVMLPQGEFRKLLTSQTENKEAILRRLFKTESYKQMNDILKNKKAEVEKEYQSAEQTKNHYIDRIQATLPMREEAKISLVLSEEYYNVHQVVEGLKEEASYYQNKIIEDKKKYEESYRKHDKKQTEYHQSKALNDRFDELAKKEAELTQLQANIPLFESKKKQLEAAERAHVIIPYEKQVDERRNDEKEKSFQLLEYTKVEEQAGKELTKAQQIYQQEEDKKEERERMATKVAKLKDFLPTVQAIDRQKTELQKLARDGKKSREELDTVTEKVKRQKEQMEKESKLVHKMDEAVSQLPEKHEKLYVIGDQVKLLQDFLDRKEKQIVFTKEYQQKETAFLKMKTYYQQLEGNWMSNQASILATHLHDGEACPVCGNVEHPNKATPKQDEITKEVLDEQKKKLDKADSEFREVKLHEKNNTNELEKIEKELINHQLNPEHAKSVYDQLIIEGKALKKEVEDLKKIQKELKQTKELLESNKRQINELEMKKESVTKKYHELQSDYRSKHEVFKERMSKIPESVRELTMLEKKIEQTEQNKLRLEKAWENAQTMIQKAKEKRTQAESNVTNLKKQVDEIKTKRKEVEKEYNEQLVHANFKSEEEYQKSKISIENRTSLKEEIDRFYNNLSTVKQQIHDLQESLKDKKRIDLVKLKDELESLKNSYESAYDTYKKSTDYLEVAKDLTKNIELANEKVVELENKLGVISDLYDVIRGQNSQKVSFERYLQIEYLERIIAAANYRLRRLSNGQFYLTRSHRQESYGRQSGLGLDVYDAYTGQTRDVKTLSGGEKFNASLSLALGMSDVIQSFQGNISIRTMFIDEGFGSLDEESLHKSIDALIDLQQSGRMIGVISHVQELKAIFPAILEVKKVKEGYSQTKFVVK